MLAINPGSGPVREATAEQAAQNIEQFVRDVGLDGVSVERKPELDYGEGRFAFLLQLNGRTSEIQMPGIPLEKVRYMGTPDQNIWHFPRLYENGGSWVWGFATGQAHNSLTSSEDEG